MANRDFVIHADRDVLLERSSTTEYRVHKLLKLTNVKSAISECENALNSDGAQSVLANFDKIFSLIKFMDQINYRDLHYTFEEIIIKNLNIIGSFFTSYGNIEDIPSHLHHQFTNIIKMSIYLFAEFVESFNTKLVTDYKISLLETKGSTKKQDMIQKHAKDYDWDFEDKLRIGFEAINSIFKNNITQLYDPPFIDRVLVSYIADCCYTQLEVPSIAFVRSKPLRESIMLILKILITDYDYGHKFKVKVVKLLKSYEHLSLLLANIVIEVVKSGNNWSSLIELIVREIGDTGYSEGLKETSNRDINGGKSISVFLVEIAKHYPQVLLPNVDNLLQCLGTDPYTLRNCVLSVLKELITNILNNDELDHDGQIIRDNYIGVLKDHLFDINAFVRSKVLQLFAAIINDHCLPIYMYGLILNLAEQKLHDKSAYVVKSAIQLIKTLIRFNPYGYDFTEAVLESSIEKENNTLKKINGMLDNKEIFISSKEDWKAIESPLKSFFEKMFESDSLESFDKPELITNMKLSNVIMKIKKVLFLHDFKLAIKLILQGKETFKNEQLFKFQSKENLPEQFCLVSKNIWFSENVILQEISNDENIIDHEIDKQLYAKKYSVEVSIKYLQSYNEYKDSVKKSLHTIEELLFGDTASASIEAIDFFTTAHEFGIPSAQEGINAMLGLIYSSDKSIKEAIVNAYQTIYLTVKETNDTTERAMIVMKRLVSVVKYLNVNKRQAFQVLLNEWMNNETLDSVCIKILWSWFTKATDISHDDRVAVTMLLSLLTSVKPSIAKGNVDSLIEFGLSNCEMFVYTCQMLNQTAEEDFKRYSEDHIIVDRVLKMTIKCCIECDVQMFNNVALSAVSVIYKLVAKPDIICLKLMNKLFTSIIITCHGKDFCEKQDVQIDNDLFAKFIFFVGQIAMEYSEYLENYIAKELIQEVKHKYETKKSKMKGSNETDFHDSEASAIDKINRQIQLICDKQLVTGKGILSSFAKHILCACNSNDQCTKANGSIALVKFMVASARFCEEHLPLFINLLENSDDVVMSIDLITSFEWLIMKHPNLLDPVTDKLYSKLDDKRTQVRYSALITIIYLINQEMVKVKGQVAGIAKLLLDDSAIIKYNAKQFFKVTAGRGNTLYNVMFDIISVLSNPEDMIPEEDFLIIMKFLLPFINKDRQVEFLVDKLCLRLKDSSNDAQAYYISSCLVFIKHSDKSLIKLSDNMPRYTDKLKNPKVYKNFNQIISDNSRMAKPHIKDILSELTEKIEKVVQDEDFITVQPSQKTLGKGLTTAKKKPAKSTFKEVSSKDEMEPLQVTNRTTRCCSNVKRKLMVSDSEEEENNEELAHSKVVSNIQQTTIQNQNSSCKTHDDVAILKRNTTQQIMQDSTPKKKLRYKSKKA